MAITKNGFIIEINSGTETCASLFADGSNSGDVYMSREVLSNGVTLGLVLYSYTLKETYMIEVKSGATLNQQQEELHIVGHNDATNYSLRVAGTYTLGTALVINGVTYPDPMSILRMSYGDGDASTSWTLAQNLRIDNGGTCNFNGQVFASGRRQITSASGALNLNFNCRWTTTHHWNGGQCQFNTGNGTIVGGDFFEVIKGGTANANLLNWSSYPNNTFFNNITGLELGSDQTITGFSFNAPTMNFIPTGNTDAIMLNTKRLSSDFTVTIANGGNYGDIEWRSSFTGSVVDESFTNLTGAKVYTIDTDNGNRYNNGRYSTADIVDTYTTNGSGEFSDDILLAYYGVTQADAAAIPTRPIDFRFPIVMSVYKYGNSVVQLNVGDQVEESTQQFISLTDTSITVLVKAIVDAYTTIDTSTRFYDRASAYLEDNWGTYLSNIVMRSGNLIDANGYNVTFDATAGSAFAFNGTTITIKTSAFEGDITTTGTVSFANGATSLGSVTDSGGTVFATSVEILDLTDANIYIEDNVGAQYDYQTNVTGTYNNVTPLGATGTWKVVVDRSGYIAAKYAFTADGAARSFDGTLTLLTQPSGATMYNGSSSAILSVVPSTDGSLMLIRIGNGTVTAQEIFDECEDALKTAAGMEYLGNGGGRVEFANLPTGTYLYMKDNVRLIRDNAGDSSATVEAFVTSTDGVIMDGTNGDVQFVTVTRAQQLTEYNYAITIDVANGTNSSVYPFGTQSNPVDSWSNAKILADFYALRLINVQGTVALNADAEGYVFHGGNDADAIDLAGYSVLNSTFEHMNMTGTGTGTRSCEFVNLLSGALSLNGAYLECSLTSDTTLEAGATVLMSRCVSAVAGLGAPKITHGSNTQLSNRGYNGGLTLAGSTAGCNTTVEYNAGKITIDATNTGGAISVRGIPLSAITDSSAGATVDLTASFDFASSANLGVVNTGVQKASLSIPHTEDLG